MCLHILNRQEQIGWYFAYYNNLSGKRKETKDDGVPFIPGKPEGIPEELGAAHSKNLRGRSPDLSQVPSRIRGIHYKVQWLFSICPPHSGHRYISIWKRQLGNFRNQLDFTRDKNIINTFGTFKN
jgi:hypothetical protein